MLTSNNNKYLKAALMAFSACKIKLLTLLNKILIWIKNSKFKIVIKKNLRHLIIEIFRS